MIRFLTSSKRKYTHDQPLAKRSKTTTTPPKKKRVSFTPFAPGVHRLDTDAELHFVKRAVHATPALFEQMWKDYDLIPPTPNPYGSGFIRRKQGLYTVQNGPTKYIFGSQSSHMINTVESAHTLVKLCLQHARQWFSLHNFDVTFAGLHCNFYNSGKAWVDWHHDEINTKQPYILSYSFYDRHDASRQFRLARKTHTRKLYGSLPVGTVHMTNGDLVVMKGSQFQHAFVHSVPKSYKKADQNSRRINITIRLWNTHSAKTITQSHN